MQNGVDWHNTLKYVNTLRSVEQYPLRSVIETAVTGAVWTNVRISECYPDQSPICVRCNQAPDTELHMYWQCPANCN